ncbi:MAG: PepSY-associated TM helix domain-containing protein [bacterium]
MPPSDSTIHRYLLLVHRWIALVATILILVVAITGSALVFEGAIDRGLHPELWRVTPTGSPVSFDTLVANARASMPKAQVSGLTLSPVPDRAHVASAGATQIFLNPYTGAVIGTRTIAEWNASLPRRLHVLHVSLMSGKVGGEIVGIVTALAFVLVLTGLVIWWRDKLWRIRWSASWKRIVFDLHHSLGAFAAIILLIISLSGMFIHYPTLSALMSSLNSAPAAPALEQPKADGGAHGISVDSLSRTALATLPGARIMFFSFPAKNTQPYTVAMRFPEDHTPGGRSRVVVDRYRGTILLATSTRQAELGNRIGNAIRSVHTGDLFGKPTEAIWLAAAIILATQGITGVTMWWNGRAARAALQRRSVV